MPEPEKTCLSCGRRIEWRKKWERDFDEVTYCSQACRRRGVNAEDHRLESALRELLAQRPRGGTVSDAEVAAAVAITGGPDLSEPARRAARRLRATGEVEILQHRRVVDPSTAKGPIAIRAAP